MGDVGNRLANPYGVAAIFFAFGVTWIVVTDYLVLSMVEDASQLTQLQTVKGWIFVAGSSILIYYLVRSGYRRHQRTNERLERSLRQSSILHRLLRHNLRNDCNVIAGNAELLEACAPAECDPYVQAIESQTAELVDRSEKMRFLQEVVFDEDEPTHRLDLVTVVEDVVADVRDAHPRSTIETKLPEALEVRTDPRVERAVRELVENAVDHTDRRDPTVSIDLETDDGAAVLTITDDGPGLPEMEREVLEDGIETQMFHSEGLGLWIAHSVLDRSGGSVTIRTNDSRGTVVDVELPAAATDSVVGVAPA